MNPGVLKNSTSASVHGSRLKLLISVSIYTTQPATLDVGSLLPTPLRRTYTGNCSFVTSFPEARHHR